MKDGVLRRLKMVCMNGARIGPAWWARAMAIFELVFTLSYVYQSRVRVGSAGGNDRNSSTQATFMTPKTLTSRQASDPSLLVAGAAQNDVSSTNPLQEECDQKALRECELRTVWRDTTTLRILALFMLNTLTSVSSIAARRQASPPSLHVAGPAQWY